MTDRHMQMTFLEFIEAFARVADKVSFVAFRNKVI